LISAGSSQKVIHHLLCPRLTAACLQPFRIQGVANLLKRASSPMRRFPAQFTDPEQCLHFAVQGAEGLSAFAPLSTSAFSFPRGPKFHYSDTAVELGDGTENLTDQPAGGIIRVRGEIRARVGGNDLAAGIGELLEDDLANHQIAGQPGRVLHQDDLHAVGFDAIK
jgi:hypothetical protein